MPFPSAGQLRGSASSWFRIDGHRFVPTFSIGTDVGETFDEMARELVDYRLARYLFTKRGLLGAPARLKVIQAQGRPILMLNREHNPPLPEGEASFVADDVVYMGRFVKIALNAASQGSDSHNVLPDVLRSWFGSDAGRPGTAQYVELVPGEPHWHMRPASHPASGVQADEDVI